MFRSGRERSDNKEPENGNRDWLTGGEGGVASYKDEVPGKLLLST